MIAATARVPTDVIRLLVLDECGRLSHRRAVDLPSLIRPGDLVVANDAATIPASLHGTHLRSGQPIELRLAGHKAAPLRAVAGLDFGAVAFGAGDYHTPTEHRPPPPVMHRGDVLALGSLRATVVAVHEHPRLIDVRFGHSLASMWEGLAHHGRPVQYSYIQDRLGIWDTWTSVAGRPLAFEAPSAGFALDWATLRTLRVRGVQFTTVTLAAGISSTGDSALDRLLPFDEPYEIPPSTASALADVRHRSGRVVAVGTTVVRALEAAAARDGSIAAGTGIATQRIGPQTHLRVADAILSGVHEAGSSHYELLRAFQPDNWLQLMTNEAEAAGYRAHEFGDAVLVWRTGVRATRTGSPP